MVISEVKIAYGHIAPCKHSPTRRIKKVVRFFEPG